MHYSKSRFLAAALAAGALATLAPARASASPIFPAQIQMDLSLKYLPACTLCHEGAPGLTTAKTLFAESMQKAGLEPNDLTSLDKALNTLETNMTDSDGDGIPDITELKDDTDPNTAGKNEVPTIAYGCFATSELAGQSSAPWGGAALTVLGLAFVMRRRRRR